MRRQQVAVESLESRQFFSTIRLSSISGSVFTDLNLNGRQDGRETGVRKAVIFLDLNNNSTFDKRTEPAVQTDKRGAFVFSNLRAGTYRVRELSSSTTAVSAPSSGWFRVNLAAGKSVVKRQFGNVAVTTSTSSHDFTPHGFLAGGQFVTAPTLGAITGSVYHSIGASGSIQFNGTAFNTSDLLVKYRYNGDANLNGRIDGADYSRIDSGFQNSHVGGWFNGDFDYNGKVDGSDYALIDTAFASQQGVLATLLPRLGA